MIPSSHARYRWGCLAGFDRNAREVARRRCRCGTDSGRHRPRSPRRRNCVRCAEARSSTCGASATGPSMTDLGVLGGGRGVRPATRCWPGRLDGAFRQRGEHRFPRPSSCWRRYRLKNWKHSQSGFGKSQASTGTGRNSWPHGEAETRSGGLLPQMGRRAMWWSAKGDHWHSSYRPLPLLNGRYWSRQDGAEARDPEVSGLGVAVFRHSRVCRWFPALRPTVSRPASWRVRRVAESRPVKLFLCPPCERRARAGLTQW